MDNFLTSLRKNSAVFFSVLFVSTAAIAFGLYYIENSAFNADLYIQALEDQNVYRRLPDLTGKAMVFLSQQPESEDTLVRLNSVSENEWGALVEILLPPDELKILTDEAITNAMAYINNENNEAVLSLTSLKAHLKSPAGINSVIRLLESQPDCSSEELVALAMGGSDISFCNPPDSILDIDLQSAIVNTIESAIDIVPDQVTLIPASSTQSQDLESINDLRKIMRLSPIIPILCLFMITLLAVRSLRDWLVWWGYPLLFAGFISVLFAWISAPLASGFYQIVIGPSLPEQMPPDIAIVIKDLVVSIIRNAIQPVVILGAFTAFVGLLMVISNFLFGERLQGYQPEDLYEA